MKAIDLSSISCSLMQGKFMLRYDNDSRVFIKECSERITIEDIIDSWEEIMKNYSLPEDARGIILDYSNAHMDFSAQEHQKIVDFYVENLDFFSKYRIGVVANNPHNIVIFMLIARADERYLLRPFTTLGAALVWVRN